MKIWSGIFFVLCFCLPPFAAVAEGFIQSHKHLLIPRNCLNNQDVTGSASDGDLNRYGEEIISDPAAINQLIETGRAMVYPADYEDIKTIEGLLEIENKARTAKRGCWSDNYKIFKAADNLPTGRFLIIEGRVLDIHKSYENTYLNFGNDWKTDFTVRIINKNKSFKEIDMKAFQGQEIRVRGFVEYYNGPSLTLDHHVLLENVTRPTAGDP